jgi:methionyl aminopeptidase
MKKAGWITAMVNKEVMNHCEPGITTRELDKIAESKCRELGGKPAFKGLYGFPASLCASPNEQVVHGIPNDTPLKEGDILSYDFGVNYEGFHGDSAVTVPIGQVSEEVEKLLQVTEASLFAGIEKFSEGNRLFDISNAVQKVVENAGFSVVKSFVGHGIGRNLHEEPQVPNYGPAGKGIPLQKGMALAIEPMVNIGVEDVEVLDDKWTVVTKDGKWSAHFEHTVFLTDKGPEILTSRENL